MLQFKNFCQEINLIQNQNHFRKAQKLENQLDVYNNY